MRWIVILFAFIQFQARGAEMPFVISGTYSPANSSLSIYLLVPPAPGKPASLLRTQLHDGKFAFEGNYNSLGIIIAKILVDSSADKTLSQLSKVKVQHEIVLDARLHIIIDGKSGRLTVMDSPVNTDLATLKFIESTFHKRNSGQLAYYSQLLDFAVQFKNSKLLPTVRERIMRMPPQLKARLVPEIINMLAVSDSSFENTSAARQLKAEISKINAVKKYAPGTILPDYIFNDGKDTVSVSQYRGKYLLIYFWASWSNESLRYQKKLEDAFLHYPTKLFSVLQVSMDSDLESWKRYFNSRKVLWKQARLVRGWDEKVQGAFDIHGLPCTYMIDPNGKILGKDLSIGELVEILRKLPS